MARALIIGITLLAALPVSAWAQPRRIETTEPPIAEGMTDVNLQQVGAQIPLRPVPTANTYQTPIVTVTVIAPQYVAANKDIEYRLRVENTSNILAKDVHVINPLPKGGTFVSAYPQPQAATHPLTWDIGNLAGGAKKEITVTVKPGADMTDWKHEVRVRFEHGRTATTKIAKPDLDVKLVVPTAQQFDKVPLQLTVSNTGMEEIKDVQVTMQLADGLAHQYDLLPGQKQDPLNVAQMRTWKIDRLAPRETKYLPCRVAVEKSGSFDVQATAKAGSINRVAKAKLTAGGAKLEIAVNGPSTHSAHETATQRITIRNGGNALLQNITVTDKVPAFCQVIKTSNDGQSFENTVQWLIPQLSPNEQCVLELVTKTSQPGKHQHQLTASCRGINENRTFVTDFREAAAVRFDVRAEQDTTTVGQMARFNIIVENSGSAPANNTRLVVILPPSLGYVSGSPETHQHESGRVTFSPAPVPAGQKLTFAVTARALRAALPAIVSAELAGDQLEGGSVRRQESIAITDPKGTAPPP